MKIVEPSLNIRVATPCHARWEEMEGDERTRFCGQCRKNVYNLSALSASAVADLIREKEGRLCGRFFQRSDGTVLHAGDCTVGLAARQWRRVRHMAGAAASLMLLLPGGNRVLAGEPAGKDKTPPPQPPDGNLVMGKICVVPPPSPTPKPTPTPKPKT